MELLNRGWLVLKRRWPLLTLPLLIAVAAAVAFIEFLPKDYTASTQLFLRAPDVKSSASAYQGNMFTMQRLNTYVEMVRSDDLAQLVVDKLGLDESAHDLAAGVSAEPIKDTVLLNISFKDRSAEQAANLANTYGTEFATYVAKVENVSLNADAPPLVATVKVANPSDATTSRFSPRLVLSAAAALGLVIGLLLMWLAERFDNKLRSRDQIEQLSGSRVLGNLRSRNDLDGDGAVAAAFTSSADFADDARVLSIAAEHALREVGEKDGRAVVALVSPDEGDGKSVVADTLAVAFTERGARVGLLRVGPRGLSWTGGADRTETLRVQGGQRVMVKPVADSEGAPSEQAISRAIQELTSANDVVIVDPSGTGVSPNVQMSATLSDAVVIVVRPGRTDEVALTDLANAMELLGTPVAGVVSNQAKETNTSQRFYA